MYILFDKFWIPWLSWLLSELYPVYSQYMQMKSHIYIYIVNGRAPSQLPDQWSPNGNVPTTGSMKKVPIEGSSQDQNMDFNHQPPLWQNEETRSLQPGQNEEFALFWNSPPTYSPRPRAYTSADPRSQLVLTGHGIPGYPICLACWCVAPDPFFLDCWDMDVEITIYIYIIYIYRI